MRAGTTGGHRFDAIVGEVVRFFPDLDPEAYVLQIFQLAVAAVGVGDALIELLPEAEEHGPLQRQTRELIRIARASLFIPTCHQPIGDDRGELLQGQ